MYDVLRDTVSNEHTIFNGGESMTENKQDFSYDKLFDEGEDLDKLIAEYLTQEEAEELKQAGFCKEQIAYVAKEKMKGEKQGKVIEKVLDILSWVMPPW